MADKLISGLPEATSIAGNDLLVTEQTSIAKKITADNLLQSLATMWTAHGGVESFDLYSQSGLSKTYRMTYADGTYTDITITDGTGITDIVTTTSGLTHTITISLNDGTTKVFTVDDGVGISSISSPSTVGLEDTYTINLSDGSSSTFTVTNGASVSSITLNGTTITFTKDDGNMIDLPVPTLRIRYSQTQPDDDNDIITTPSNWMGVAWALDSAVLHYTDYSWFKIKGETGDNAEVSTYQRQYKYTDDGTQYPTSGYYSTIAAAQSAVGGAIQGKYLWIATTITWNNGTPSVIYTSSYQGLDGTGLSGVVKSLYMSDTSTSLAPDANGQVTVTSADVGAIKAPATASDGQVLTWDATDQVWYAGSVSTGTVESVNSQLPDASGNVTIYGTNVAMSSNDATTVKAAIDAKADASAYLPLTGGTLSGNLYVGDSSVEAKYSVALKNANKEANFSVSANGTFGIYDVINDNWVFFRAYNDTDYARVHTPPADSNTTHIANTAWVNSKGLKVTSKTVAASGWTAETKTSTSGRSYTYYYRFSVTGITANDLVDASIESGTYTGNWAVESGSGYIYIHTTTQPTESLTFNIYYKVGM